MELFIILLILSLILNPIIAKSKNRSPVGWFFLAFLLLGILSTIILLILPKGGKKCPKCAETINPDATVCRYCHFEFTKLEKEIAKDKWGIPLNPETK